jgi:hypothetical protein
LVVLLDLLAVPEALLDILLGRQDLLVLRDLPDLPDHLDLLENLEFLVCLVNLVCLV